MTLLTFRTAPLLRALAKLFSESSHHVLALHKRYRRISSNINKVKPDPPDGTSPWKKGNIRVLIISGPVGVGKTSVANAISELLTKRSVSNAVIDLDGLRNVYPRPPEDPFHTALGYKNLAAVWQNDKEAGVTHIIIPSVTEGADDIASIQSAIPEAEIKILRLKAKLETIHLRLENREAGESLVWHQNRAKELHEQLESNPIEDFVVDTDGKTVKQVAEEVLSRSGLLA